MEPRIQYAKTSDGVSIAYCVMGEGPTVVFATTTWGDVHMYSHNPDTRKGVDALVALGLRVVRYDGRGMGSSDRDSVDYSMEARIAELDAVIECLGSESVALCGYQNGGPVAIAYSVQHPERVSHLILVNSYVAGHRYYEAIPAMRVVGEMRGMIEDQWEFFTLTLATATTEFADSEIARKRADFFREGMRAEAYLAYFAAVEQSDVEDLLEKVTVPTLVVHDRPVHISSPDQIRVLASGIPNARFVATSDYPAALGEFLGVSQAPSESDRDLASGTAIILFADIAESTALTEQLGDAAFRAKARELDTSLRSVIRECAGTPVEGKVLGDGVLAVFTSARQAIDCALRCDAAGQPLGLRLHLGIHAGDVIREGNNVYGGAVNIAARIAAASEPGEVLVSDTVRGLARTSVSVSFDDRGEHTLKGVGEPQRLFAVRGDG